MKFKVGKVIIGILIIGLLSGCNRTIIDTTYKFNKAIIKLQNGEVLEVNVKRWLDYEGEQLQIETEDGKVYLVNSVNATLIKE